MCGFAGFLARSDRSGGETVLRAMLATLGHRGPDAEGYALRSVQGGERRLALGHRRLSIIDPDGPAQPLHDEEAGLSLVFNGEIYNYRELGRTLEAIGYRLERGSDTEVLLKAYRHWGPDVVTRLRGMFAFAVWDARNERLTLARDRFGEKPLFLYEDGGDLYFASEIKALLEAPRVRVETDGDAVWDYLAYRYVPAPRTLFRGIRKLLPGSVATWERGEFREHRYWTSRDREARPALELPQDRVGSFLARLDEAVRVQMVSDVPFGAFLSGGLDSSTIVALMRRHNEDVKTFSVGFGDPRYSELPFAGQVARDLGTRHHEIIVSEDDLMRHLPDLVRHRDAPVSEPSDIPVYLLAKAAARDVKMVLTGEGSDELLGGYPKHVAERFVGAWQSLPNALRNGLLAPLVAALPYRFRRAKTAITNLNIPDSRDRYVRWFGALSNAERAALTGRRNGVHYDGPQFATDAANSSLRRMLYFDQSSWLPDNLLERTDRMTMAASIEARVPFLDHELAEFVSTLPDRDRVRGGRRKWILRKAAERLLPRTILKRPKVGFRVPVNDWFRGPMRDYLLDHLRGKDSLAREYCDPAMLDRVLDEHLDGRQNHEKLLWSLLNLDIWHKSHAGR